MLAPQSSAIGERASCSKTERMSCQSDAELRDAATPSIADLHEWVDDAFSTTTGSIAPSCSAHLCEESMATVIVRTLAAHLLGMMIGVPLLLLTIVALMIVVPVRLFFCLVARALPTRWRSRVHYTFALAPRSCDMWWPLSKHADAYASLVQCIVTLQSSIDLRTARQDILNKVIVPSTRSATYATHRDSANPQQQQLLSNVNTPRIPALPRHVRNFHKYPPYVQQQSCTNLAARHRGGRTPSVRVTGCAPTCQQWHTDSMFDIDNHVIEIASLNQRALRTTAPSTGNLMAASSSATLSVHHSAHGSEIGVHDTVSSTAQLSARSRVASLRDLELYVNYPSSQWTRRRPPWCIKLLPSFGNVDDGTCCSLVLIEMQSCLVDGLCPLRFLTLWSDGRLVFDNEPKPRTIPVPHYNLCMSVSAALATLCRALFTAPLALLLGAVRRPSPVWKHCIQRLAEQNGARKRPANKRGRRATAPTALPGRRYRVSSTATSGNGSVKDSRKPSLVVTGACTPLVGIGLTMKHQRVTWARISNMDQVMRAERVLRAQTIDLLLAFVAGALRRHLRANGIRHPPNTRVIVPVSGRNHSAVSRTLSCDFNVVPTLMPTGVEGCIPRVWAVQRALSAPSSFALGTRMASRIGACVLPHCALTWLLRHTYADTACAVSYVRTTGDPALQARRIHSLLCYTPLPDHILAHFGFIQCGTEMVVTLTADTDMFPEPDRLLAYFQADVLSLLRQLSCRLLTLAQATFLPPQVQPEPQRHSVSHERPLITSVDLRRSETGADRWLPAVTVSYSPPPPVDDTIDIETTVNSSASYSRTLSESHTHLSAAMLPPLRPEYIKQRTLSTGGRFFVRCTPLAADRCHSDSLQTAGSPRRQGPDRSASVSVIVSPSDGSGTISANELDDLMGLVQRELDTLRTNPHADRHVYEQRLNELQAKMDLFHRSLAAHLPAGSQSCSHLGAAVVQLTPAAENAIAPMLIGDRRASLSITPTTSKYRTTRRSGGGSSTRLDSSPSRSSRSDLSTKHYGPDNV